VLSFAPGQLMEALSKKLVDLQGNLNILDQENDLSLPVHSETNQNLGENHEGRKTYLLIFISVETHFPLLGILSQDNALDFQAREASNFRNILISRLRMIDFRTGERRKNKT